jgi:hypothetical protein
VSKINFKLKINKKYIYGRTKSTKFLHPTKEIHKIDQSKGKVIMTPISLNKCYKLCSQAFRLRVQYKQQKGEGCRKLQFAFFISELRITTTIDITLPY